MFTSAELDYETLVGTPTPGLLAIQVLGDRVVLKGEIDMATADDVRSAVEPRCRAGEVLLLDVSGVNFIDSTGLRGLIGLAMLCRKREGDVQLLGASAQVVRLLEVTGMTEFFLSPDS